MGKRNFLVFSYIIFTMDWDDGEKKKRRREREIATNFSVETR